MPYFVCQEWGNQCVKACGMDNECSSDCRENHPCGAQSPKRVNSTTSSTMSATASSSSSGQVYTGIPGSDNTQGNLAAPVLEAGRSLGFVIVLGGIVAGIAWTL